jgi:hypothetical protein
MEDYDNGDHKYDDDDDDDDSGDDNVHHLHLIVR